MKRSRLFILAALGMALAGAAPGSPTAPDDPLGEAEALQRGVQPWQSDAWHDLLAPGSIESEPRIAFARALLEQLDGLGVDAARILAVRRFLIRFVGDADDPYEPALMTGAREPLRMLEAFLSRPAVRTEGEGEIRLQQAESLATVIEEITERIVSGAVAGRAPSRGAVEAVMEAAEQWTTEELIHALRRMFESDAAVLGPRAERSLDLRLRVRTAVRLSEAISAYQTALQTRVLSLATEAPGWSGSEAGRRAFARSVEEALGEPVDPLVIARQAHAELVRLRSEIILTLKRPDVQSWATDPRRDPADAQDFEETMRMLRERLAAQAFISDRELLLHARAEAKDHDARVLSFARTPPALPYGVEVSDVSVPFAEHGDFAASRAAMLHLPSIERHPIGPSLLSALLRELGPRGRLLAIDRAEAAGAPRDDPFVRNFVQAWGLYAARVTGDPADGTDHLALLLRELAVAAPWAADVMVHVEGRPLDEVRRMLEAHHAPLGEDPGVTLQRVLDAPGHASAVKPMEIRLRELRRASQAEFGAALNDPAFHETVLHGGPAAQGELTQRLRAWKRRLPIGLSFD